MRCPAAGSGRVRGADIATVVLPHECGDRSRSTVLR
jgi:hypothetical protein